MGVIAGRFSTMFYGESVPESSYRKFWYLINLRALPHPKNT